MLSNARGRVMLCDTITALDESDAGAIVVTGSHGGSSAAHFALAVPLRLVVFNDAGVGKDRAGIVALDRLQARGVAAATVSHQSARIGDADETWRHGVVSQLNDAAREFGLRVGDEVSA
ncbi:MAG TPA: hypothetical protein VNG69_06615, partial [Casimicrobiaceae bacterium]|nr:hypothetical protein [Casimicrobiaceae bacterium]